jgi:hypothetical protein
MKKIQNALKLPALVAVLTVAGSFSSLALPLTVLTFEGLGDQASIGNYYNGGAGGNFGITFGSDSLSLISYTAGGSGNFTGAPSGVTVAFFLSGPGDVMDVAGGFNTGFSFYYADQAGFTGSVSVYDGLNGSGNLLASLSLPSTPNPYNVWVPVGVTFAGTAESVVFSGAANYIGFDNITLGSSTAGGGSVPDGGATAVMLGLGLISLVGFSRRLAVATVTK